MRFYFNFFLLLLGSFAQAQKSPGVMDFLTAQGYDRFEGAARATMVQQLQDDGWFAIDTFFEMSAKPGETLFRTEKHHLAPYMDENGQVVHLVPDVAPKFPGGAAALQLYKSDVLGPLQAGPNDGVQNSVYIRCVIDPSGKVTQVAEIQPNLDSTALALCLDAVRYMPDWSPGLYRGKPVNVCVMIDFSLK